MYENANLKENLLPGSYNENILKDNAIKNKEWYNIPSDNIELKIKGGKQKGLVVSVLLLYYSFNRMEDFQVIILLHRKHSFVKEEIS
jgi:hypothetical protein